MDLDSLLRIAIAAAKQAGEIHRKWFGKLKSFEFKEDHSLITEVDISSEECIKNYLRGETPGFSILAEESGSLHGGSEYLWVIDPLDGTTNYTHMIPFFSISIALYKHSEVILGVVYNPLTHEIFYAKLNGGAYLNDKEISVAKTNSLKESFISFCHAPDEESVRKISVAFSKLKRITSRVRQVGAASLELSYVAAGRFDAFIMFGVKPWDVSAGVLIVKEAGGVVSDLKGEAFNFSSKDIIATNSFLHSSLISLLGDRN